MTFVESNFDGLIITPALCVDSPSDIVDETTSESAQSCPDCRILTRRLSRGDEGAFREFWKLYFNRLLRYVFVVAGGQEEIAREALQLTCVRVARHVRPFDSESAFWNWLAMVARHCVTDEMRKHSRYHKLLARFTRQQSAEADLKSTDADARLSELMQEGLAGLPADESALLEQKYLDGRPVRELADERQMTEKAVESLLGRVRRKLKAKVLERLQNE
jgi:RNA polymerase sigma-70 factor (ECF subfamily)